MKIIKVVTIFLKASWKDKIEIIEYVFDTLKERFIDYWLGHVSIISQDIWDGDKKYLYTYSIIVGQYRKGAWFSELDAKGIPKLIEQLKQTKGRFELYANYGCGGYNQYTLNENQVKMLLGKLEELNKQEIYYED